MYRLGPGQATYIYDYSTNPRLLLGLLSGPILELRDEGIPLVHVQRGWLHGTHLVVTVRPLGATPVDLGRFTTVAGEIAAQLTASPPDEPDYLTRAAQLARWEDVSAPLLPLHPQGFTETRPVATPHGWSEDLLRSRDQLAGLLLEPILASAQLPPADVLPHAARILALCALAHPYGIGPGTLSMRSHTEAILSATGGTVDLRASFVERFERDRAVFLAALRDPAIAGTGGGEPAATYRWANALHACWGAALAITAAGIVDEDDLLAGQLPEAPMANGIHSPFHHAVRLSGINEWQPYWHVAYRLIINIVYSSLSCLGITPLQRYYLCFGLSCAADEILGEDWEQRVERIARFQAAASV